MLYVDASAPTIATPSDQPAPETVPPAAADITRWTEKLTAVPTLAALSAAEHLGALLANRGSSGEVDYIYGYHAINGWYRVDYYDDHELVDDVDLPAELEIDSWPSSDPRAGERTMSELNAEVDRQAESLYLGLAEDAASQGETAAFRAAVEAIYEVDPFVMDADLFAQLAGVDLADDGLYRDEDCERWPER